LDHSGESRHGGSCVGLINTQEVAFTETV
jgi:hypothetical protein